MDDSIETPTPIAGWSDLAQVDWYTKRIGRLEARLAGEQMLVDVLPREPRRLLDLGCGDGRLTALVLSCRPSIEDSVAVDCSPPMLELARKRFDGDPRVEVKAWDLKESIRPLGRFDLVVSGFAIHHVSDTRKRELFREVVGQLEGGGSFINLEVIASATAERHAEFLAAIGRTANDPEDQLTPIEDQLAWMRDAGMANVDCLWRWRGFALLVGQVH